MSKNDKNREIAKNRANEIVRLTVAEAKSLPNMLGKIVPVQLSEYGWYAREHDGKVTFYELAA